MSPDAFVSQPEQSAGSSLKGEPAFVVVGKLHRPHGIAGEIFMQVQTDYPERLQVGTQVFLGKAHVPHRIRSIRSHKNGLLIAFEQYNTPEAVGVLRHQGIFMQISDLPALPPDEYYHHQLIGLRVIDLDGKELGHVREILETGAHDVLVIQDDNGKEHLLPYVDEMIQKVDLQEQVLQAAPIPGIFS